MAMVRWDPFSEMMTVQRDMNRLFSSLGMPLYKGDGERVAWMPTLDVIRRGDDLVIRAELPGVRPQDVDVSVTDDMLTIKGKRDEKAEYREGQYLRKESSYGTFERQVMLPQGIGAQDISAGYADGILEITVRNAGKASQPQTQHIPISGAGQASGQQPMQGGMQNTQQIAVGGEGRQGDRGY
jgi:HSP20 family protein